MTNYLANFDAQTLPTLADCILVSGESVRFTSVGRRRYAERFARAGIDINKVRTMTQLQTALESSAGEELVAFAQHGKAKHRAGIERDWLIAAAAGTEFERAQLSAKLRALTRSGRDHQK